MDTKAFALAGPPASGKTTLLRFIPLIVRDSVAIDLESFGPVGGAQALRRGLLDSILATARNGVLFLGVADVPFAEFTHKGVEVIGLYANDRDRYLERLKERNLAGGSVAYEQAEHFSGCMQQLELLRSQNQLTLEIDIFDPRLEGKPLATVEFIAKGLSLPTYSSQERCDRENPRTFSRWNAKLQAFWRKHLMSRCRRSAA